MSVSLFSAVRVKHITQAGQYVIGLNESTHPTTPLLSFQHPVYYPVGMVMFLALGHQVSQKDPTFKRNGVPGTPFLQSQAQTLYYMCHGITFAMVLPVSNMYITCIYLHHNCCSLLPSRPRFFWTSAEISYAKSYQIR